MTKMPRIGGGVTEHIPKVLPAFTWILFGSHANIRRIEGVF